MNKVGAYFIGQLTKDYKLADLKFSSYSLHEIKEFVSQRGGTIWDSEGVELFKFPTNYEHLFSHAQEQNPSLHPQIAMTFTFLT